MLNNVINAPSNIQSWDWLARETRGRWRSKVRFIL